MFHALAMHKKPNASHLESDESRSHTKDSTVDIY